LPYSATLGERCRANVVGCNPVIFHLSLIIWRLSVHWIVAQNRAYSEEIANDKWKMENGKWKMENPD